jgi:hypothetical protein
MERLGIDDVAGLTLYCVRHALVDPRLDGRRVQVHHQAVG